MSKRIRITKQEFDNILYPALGASAPSDMAEAETAAKLMRKIKSHEHIQEAQLPPLQQGMTQSVYRPGELVPYRTANANVIDLILENDEVEMIVKAIGNFITRIPIIAADIVFDFLKKVIGVEDES